MPGKIMFRTGLLIFVAMLGCLFFPAYAQVQGKLEGRVFDQAGNPLEKVEVTIISQKTTAVHYNLLTDREGRFIQVGLMPGYYIVNLKKSGFAPASTEIRVTVAGEEKIQVTMKSLETVDQKALSAADKLFLRGNSLYASQKYAEAVAVYEEAIKSNSTNWAYYLNLGLAFKKLNRSEDALKVFEKAVELNPESFSANKEYGEALARVENIEAARKYYEKAVSLSPDDPDIHYNLGLLLHGTGEPELALSHFGKAIELRPEYAEAYFEMGTIYIGQNKVPEAIVNLEKFIQLAPKHDKAAVAKQLLEYLKK